MNKGLEKCDKCDYFISVEEAYQMGRADALDIDMEKPMHFTDEQKAWIKNYIIINAKRQREDAIDEVFEKADEKMKEQIAYLEKYSKRNGKMWARYMATYLGHIKSACKQLKENEE